MSNLKSLKTASESGISVLSLASTLLKTSISCTETKDNAVPWLLPLAVRPTRIFCIAGMTKAPVFPDPVLARASKSFPSNM
ncbi:hypothetical protein E2C01_024984 [Portunus trituberculatus]|uniref:Uncharacterized protein n=1 Tax=Portunus trituberculatus TaxID=210409 RepID=A0A5B7EDW5_PORTR|nr:hypothetical protein [Portunus trituberculatus]